MRKHGGIPDGAAEGGRSGAEGNETGVDVTTRGSENTGTANGRNKDGATAGTAAAAATPVKEPNPGTVEGAERKGTEKAEQTEEEQ